VTEPKTPWILILAGGAGTRFWPASRRDRPKHVLPGLGGDGRTLLEATIARVLPLTRPERVFVVTAADQVDIIAPHLHGLPASQVIAEPEPKNTGPAVTLGILTLTQRGAGPHSPVVVLPADAWVDDEAAFRASILRASAAAEQHKAIVTLGITPTRPETGYGYIQLGEDDVEVTGGGDAAVTQVARFVEKPDRAGAEAMVADDRNLWNAGIFVFRLGYLWWLLGDLSDEWDLALMMINACLVDGDPEALAHEYGKFESISIDNGVIEHAPSLLCVRADWGWSDLGSWDAVAQVMDTAPGGVARADRVIAKAAGGNVIFAPGKTVALLGVDDLVVVATDDVVLVAPRSRAQEVRELAAAAAPQEDAAADDASDEAAE